MPTVYKILGQAAPLGNSEVTLYSVPVGRSAVVSSITICNRDTDPATVRVSISQSGAATGIKDYLYYDLPIDPSDTFIATIGVTLAATDIVRVRASGLGGDNISFQAFGSEII